jgi:peptidoglycan/xylan/chitin deacetylase (PgdA/CDA1 family)
MVVVFALILAAAAISHMAPFPFLLEAFRPSRSLWHVEQSRRDTPSIFLTFDDGPNPIWTPALLDALEEERVSATFFLIDKYITPETEPIVRRMAADGHAIGLHTGTRGPVVMAPDVLAARLTRASGRIASITGREPCQLFRPHAGWRSATLYEGLDAAGFRLAGWTWGMWDWDWWQKPRAEKVAKRLVRKASPGDIIVIHDGHHANPRADRRHAAGAVRLLAPAMRARGWTFGRLCDMPAVNASTPGAQSSTLQDVGPGNQGKSAAGVEGWEKVPVGDTL